MAQTQTSTTSAKDNKAPVKDNKAPAKGVGNGATAASATATSAEVPAKRAAKEIYIVTGEVKRFPNARDAEAFLNSDEDVPETYQVIKGNLIPQKQKVSLR